MEDYRHKNNKKNSVTIKKLGMGDDKIGKIILAVLNCMKLLKKSLLRLSPAVILGSKTFAKVLETVWNQVKFNGYITAMHSRKESFGQQREKKFRVCIFLHSDWIRKFTE